MTGARRTPLLSRFGAECSFWAMTSTHGPRERVADDGKKQDRRPREMRTGGTSRPTRVPEPAGAVSRHIVSKRKKLRPRLALPPHRGLEFMVEAQVFVQNGQGRFTKYGSVHASLAGLRDLSACRSRDFQSVPFTENQAHAHRLRRCGAARAGVPAAKRIANGQQNAHRRDPSRGDPGGRFARQSRRRIRL